MITIHFFHRTLDWFEGKFAGTPSVSWYIFIFMRLTPDSRAPAKADPSARAGFEFDPGGAHLGRGCADLGLGWRHLGGFSKLLLLWLLLVLLLLADVGPIWAQFCPCLGPRLAHVAHILASGSPHLGRCWPYLGLWSPYLGLMSAHVAHILADVGPMLAQACPYLSRMLTHLALLSAHVAHILADVGPMLAQACPYLSLMLTHVAHILADVGPMLAPRPSRCPVFRSGPLRKTQNPEKPMVF